MFILLFAYKPLRHKENYKIFYFATDSHRLFKINFFNIYLYKSVANSKFYVCLSTTHRVAIFLYASVVIQLFYE